MCMEFFFFLNHPSIHKLYKSFDLGLRFWGTFQSLYPWPRSITLSSFKAPLLRVWSWASSRPWDVRGDRTPRANSDLHPLSDGISFVLPVGCSLLVPKSVRRRHVYIVYMHIMYTLFGLFKWYTVLELEPVLSKPLVN